MLFFLLPRCPKCSIKGVNRTKQSSGREIKLVKLIVCFVRQHSIRGATLRIISLRMQRSGRAAVNVMTAHRFFVCLFVYKAGPDSIKLLLQIKVTVVVKCTIHGQNVSTVTKTSHEDISHRSQPCTPAMQPCKI